MVRIRPRTLIDRETQTYDETPHSGFYTQEEAKKRLSSMPLTVYYCNPQLTFRDI